MANNTEGTNECHHNDIAFSHALPKSDPLRICMYMCTLVPSHAACGLVIPCLNLSRVPRIPRLHRPVLHPTSALGKPSRAFAIRRLLPGQVFPVMHGVRLP